MFECPFCKTRNKSHFSSYIVDLNPNKYDYDTITAKVLCFYCGDEFTVEADLNWKLKDTVKEPNPKYKLLAPAWYKNENGEEFVLAYCSIVTLQGFELSTHSRFSPFKTINGDIIRLHNNIVKKI